MIEIGAVVLYTQAPLRSRYMYKIWRQETRIWLRSAANSTKLTLDGRFYGGVKDSDIDDFVSGPPSVNPDHTILLHSSDLHMQVDVRTAQVVGVESRRRKTKVANICPTTTYVIPYGDVDIHSGKR